MARPFKLSARDRRLIHYVYHESRRRLGLDPGQRGGVTKRALADHYGVDERTIHRIVAVPEPRPPRVMSPPRRLTPEERELAAQWWCEGWTTSRIAAQFGCSRQAIWLIVRGTPPPAKRWGKRSRGQLADALAAAQ